MQKLNAFNLIAPSMKFVKGVFVVDEIVFYSFLDSVRDCCYIKPYENAREELKMKRQLLALSLVVFVFGCTFKVQRSYGPVEYKPQEGKWYKVAVLPVSDYTPFMSEDAIGRRKLVEEAIEDALFSLGFVPVPKEDVMAFLTKKGVIKEVGPSFGAPAIRVLAKEVSEPWTPVTKKHLEDALRQNLLAQSVKEKPTAPLSQEVLKEMAEELGTRLVVRGRIVELKEGLKSSFNPFEVGIVPFAYGVTQRFLFGVAVPESYEFISDENLKGATPWLTEIIQKMAIGAAGGWAIVDGTSPLEWERDVAALVGGGIGSLGHLSGKLREVTVDLRLMVQDAETGDLLWTNRARVSVSPESVFSDQDLVKMREVAIREAVKALVEDFSNFFKAELPKLNPIYRELVYTPGRVRVRETKVKEVQIPLEEAKEAALKAQEAAERAERAFEKTLRK